MKKIQILYWKCKYADLIYENNQEYEYSVEKYHEISDDVISKGYSIMLRPMNTYLTIFITKGRFTQS